MVIGKTWNLAQLYFEDKDEDRPPQTVKGLPSWGLE